MQAATKEVQIIEVGDHQFLITCPIPENAQELLIEYNYSFDGKYWDEIIDRGEDGFEIYICTHNPGGEYRGLKGPDGMFTILRYAWTKLYTIGAVSSRRMPTIQFGPDGPQTTYMRG
jgi:hypothetical protein